MMVHGKQAAPCPNGDALNVLWDGKMVGELVPAGEGYVIFQYADAWLSTEARPVSLSLPCRPESFDFAVSTAYFGGMLPEGDVRAEIAAHYDMYDSDTFALLKRLGQDCAGALRVLPVDAPMREDASQEYQDITPLLENLFIHREDRLTEPNLFLETGARLSLAGSQGKLPVFFKDGRFFLPPDDVPTTHIIKPQTSRFRFLVENENFCTTLARRSGLTAALTEIVALGEQRVLCSTRFDRSFRDGRIIRIHQEDFCQAMGIPSEYKYQDDGGPGFAECRSLIERNAFTNPGRDVGGLADAALFNFLIGNTDAHGKNFALFHNADGTREMTPLYDLVSTSVYGLDGRFAMTIRSWEELAVDLEMDFSELRERKEAISGHVADATHALLKEHQERFPAGALYTQLDKLIATNLTRLDAYFRHHTLSSSSEEESEEDTSPRL